MSGAAPDESTVRSHDSAVDRIRDIVAAGEPELIAFRRRLHAEPELSFQEFDTTEWLFERLQVAGRYPQRLPSGTGLWCDIGDGPPKVALRADIDALALHEDCDLPFRSRNDGVAHACGHDVHTTAVLGAGLTLHRLAQEGRLPGAVRLLFEPGEETVPGGALEMLAAGLLRGIDCIYAVHCDPKGDVGKVGIRTGPITSASDMVEIHLHGPGGHTARPQLTVDLVSVASMLVTELPKRLAGKAGDLGPFLLVFGEIHAGHAPNVIPSEAVVRGSLRAQDARTWRALDALLAESVNEVLSPTGAMWKLNHVQGVAPVVNEPVRTAIAEQAMADLFGADSIQPAEHSWGGDSYGWLTDASAGTYIRLGTHSPEWPSRYDLHHPAFRVDERSIAVGTSLLALAALRALDADLPAQG